MKIKFNFNMVEIALATAIIAIGISSILVLFPIGINATRAAMDENCFNDISESVVEEIKSKVTAKWDSPDITVTTANNDYDPQTEESTSGTSNVGNTLKKIKDGFYKFTRTGKSDEEVFSAYIKIWKGENGGVFSCPLFVPDMMDGDKTPKPNLEIKMAGGDPVPYNEFIKSFFIEISWPTNLPQEKRNKKTFQVDIYKTDYSMTPPTPPTP